MADQFTLQHSGNSGHDPRQDWLQGLNQPQIPDSLNLYQSDLTLQYWHNQFASSSTTSRLSDYGALAGGVLTEAGFAANKHKPEFQSHDRFGKRIDQVNYHPAYHQLMAAAIDANIPSLPWLSAEKGRHVTRAALNYLHTQADPGTGCPLTMTFAAMPAIERNPELAAAWRPGLLSSRYDSANTPISSKHGLTLGMAMTEKQGGSDVRANTSQARRVGHGSWGQEFELVGHKWFCSAPMCDGFLTLAQTELGLSCFLIPRWREDGNKNTLHIQRLKDKVGNCSNASSEIEFHGAQGWLLGEEGRGINTIIDMVALTRFDCVVGSASLMRGSLTQALLHTNNRAAFGKTISQQPLMQNVLADLALDNEAALATGLRLAAMLDDGSEEASALFRLATAVGKYWVCKQAPHFCYEAMESVGGVGYVEDNATARNYREAPVNAIWEGSGNIQCLDVLRVMAKSPRSLEVFVSQLETTKDTVPAYQQALQRLKQGLQQEWRQPAFARQLVEHLALLLQSNTLLRFGDPKVAEYFVESRLNGQRGWHYGTLPAGVDYSYLVERTLPQ